MSRGLLSPPWTSEQTMLAEASQRFIAETCPLDEIRRLLDDTDGVPPGYLEQGAELGWYGMFVPEELGGGTVSDSPLADAVLVAQERGASLQPGAFVPHHVVAYALGYDAHEDELASVAEALAIGGATASWAIADSFGDWTAGRAVSAESSGRDPVLHGCAGLVQDAHRVDWLLVSASTGAGLGQFLVRANAPGVVVRPLETLDLTKRLAEVRFEGVPVEEGYVLGATGDAAPQIEAQFQRAVVLQVAESLGAMDALFERTCAYAKDRIAFGRPIGSFQAIKHLLADLSLRVEGTRASLAGAVEAVESSSEDASTIASMLKSYAGDAGVELAQGCLQVHGGIGFTWEHDLHLYLRRLTSDAALFGDPIWHRERLVALQAA